MIYKHNVLTLILTLLLVVCSCKPPEARKPVTVKTNSFINASVARNKQLNKAEYSKIEALIKKDTSNTYIASSHGFWYTYHTKLETDTLKTANFGDLVTFTYNLKTLDDSTIYTKQELGEQKYRMDKEELFSGLREGLKLLKPGEEVTFLFPSQQAYGYYGDENKIGINVPLKSRVTVLSIKHTQH